MRQTPLMSRPVMRDRALSRHRRQDLGPMAVIFVVMASLSLTWSSVAAAQSAAIIVDESADSVVMVRAERSEKPTFQVYRLPAKNTFAIEIAGAPFALSSLTFVEGPLLQNAMLDQKGATGGNRIVVTLRGDADYDARIEKNALVVSFQPFDSTPELVARFDDDKRARATAEKTRADEAARAVESQRQLALAAAQKKEEEARAREAEIREREEEAKRVAELKKREAEARALQEQIALAQRREADAKRAAEIAQKKAEEEAKRIAELARRQAEDEAKRVALEKKRAEEEAKRIAELERKRVEEEAKREALALALEKKRAEEEAKRVAELERKRVEDETKRRAEIERQRLLEEKRIADLEKKRVEEEAKRILEEERQKEREAKRIADLEKKRAEEEAKRLADIERRAALAEQEKALEAKRVVERERKRAEDEAKRIAEEKKRADALAAREEQARKDRLASVPASTNDPERFAGGNDDAGFGGTSAAAPAPSTTTHSLPAQQTEASRLRALFLEAEREREQTLRAQARRRHRENDVGADDGSADSDDDGGERGFGGAHASTRATPAPIQISMTTDQLGRQGTGSIDVSGRNHYEHTDGRSDDDDDDLGDDDVVDPGYLSEVTVERSDKTKSRVGVRVEGGARFTITRRNDHEIVLTLFDTQPGNLGVRRIVDARSLETSVLRVLPQVEDADGAKVELVIELKAPAPVQVRQDDAMLWLHVG